MNPLNAQDMNPKPDNDAEVLRLAPDDEEDEQRDGSRARRSLRGPAEIRRGEGDALLKLNAETVHEDASVSSADDHQAALGNGMGEALRWALDALHQPAMAAADWLAKDIDPEQHSAAALLSNPAITWAQVRQAKSVFKTMRIVGEKAADRRVGARMYTAAIAAGIVRHNKKVSTQSDAALQRAFKALLDDRRMPLPLRDLAGMALCVLRELSLPKSDQSTPRKSA